MGYWQIGPRHVLWMVAFSVMAVGTQEGLSSSEASETSQTVSSERFVPALSGEAVKDTKTGLVWEQTPDGFHGIWSESIVHCLGKTTGGMKGWRLPTVKELSTLIDPSQQNPALPPGHPFSNVRSAIFWTASPSTTDEIVAWHVSFLSGEVMTDQKSQTRRAWCVMGEPSDR